MGKREASLTGLEPSLLGFASAGDAASGIVI